MLLAIYIIVAIVIMVVMMFDDLTHDSPFKTRLEAIRLSALVGVLWPACVVGLLILIVSTYLSK
jgi:hypothetical protein